MGSETLFQIRFRTVNKDPADEYILKVTRSRQNKPLNDYLAWILHRSERTCEYVRTMGRHMVFVYGTLKKDEPNHHWLTREENGYSKFVSVAETMKKYPLVIASRYNVPFLLDSPGRGENVMGEVYEVDDKMLGALDILEDHPEVYVREIEKVTLVNDGKPTDNLDCWVYFLKRFKPELLSQEYFKEYRSRGSHGKPYSERESRDPNHSARLDVLLS